MDKFFDSVREIDERNQMLLACGQWLRYQPSKHAHGYDWVLVINGDGYIPFAIGLWKEIHQPNPVQ